MSSYALTAGSVGPECLADSGTTKGHNKISVVSVALGNPAAAAVIAEPALDPGTQQFDGNAFIPGLGLLTTTGCHDSTKQHYRLVGSWYAGGIANPRRR